MTITSIEIRRAASLFLPVSGVLALAVSVVPAPAVAEPLPYGPDTCIQGYTICVTPADQANGSRRVVFSAVGNGEVFSIVTDPDTGLVPDHTPLPFTRTLDIGPEVSMLQVVATGRDTPGPGCSISIDGTVVASEPIGGSGHCIYIFP